MATLPLFTPPTGANATALFYVEEEGHRGLSEVGGKIMVLSSRGGHHEAKKAKSKPDYMRKALLETYFWHVGATSYSLN